MDARVFTGKDIIEVADDTSLMEDIFNLLDPEGFNVVLEESEVKFSQYYELRALLKLKDMKEPYEKTFIITKKAHKQIVHTFSIQNREPQ